MAPGTALPTASVRNALRLETEEQADVTIREGQEESPVVKDAVVPGVRPDVALVEVDVVDAVQTIGVTELEVDRLVKVPVELRAPGVERGSWRISRGRGR